MLSMSHVHKAHESRPAVEGFAEFTSCSLTNKENESLGDKRLVHKVNCTKLQYTYPLKFLVPTQASTVPSCQWLYIITFGGGLVEGDNVAVDIKVSENCTIVVTTQASTKVFNSEAGLTTQQSLTGVVADGGLLAILPDPVVCFKDAIYSQQQDVELSSNGNVVILDWFTAGRIALGEVWDMSSYKSRNRVFVNGKLVYGDSIKLSNEMTGLSLKESMCDTLVLGSCVFIGPYFKEIKKQLRDRVNELTKCNGMNAEKKDVMAYASLLHSNECDGVVVKLLTTQSTEQANLFFQDLIQDIVPRIGGNPLIK
ncbi:uncharacterized protein LOC141884795 [Acropora palmata]|uniref:uncharacterized protein LOC141884795 n=1 Tax=Acropora palmata TaxID=6131 RepID=UPI003DA01619